MIRLSKLALALAFALTLAHTSLAQVLPPQGRLTLTSNTPVMTADVVNAGVIYYTPYIGDSLPQPNGSGGYTNVAFSQLALETDFAQYYLVGDIFAYYADSTWNICGAPWYPGGVFSSTTRGTGAGTTQLTQVGGVWVNAYNLTCYNSYTSPYTITAQYGVYLGSFANCGDGLVTVQFKPAAAAGGSNNMIGLWNAYNRVRIDSLETNSNYEWTYGTNTWRPSDGNTSSRVTFVDGLAQSFVKAKVSTMAYNPTAGSNSTIGLDENSASNTPILIASQLQASPGGNVAGAATITDEENFTPVLGLNYIQAMEISYNSVSVTFALDGVNYLLYEGEF